MSNREIRLKTCDCPEVRDRGIELTLLQQHLAKRIVRVRVTRVSLYCRFKGGMGRIQVT